MNCEIALPALEFSMPPSLYRAKLPSILARNGASSIWMSLLCSRRGTDVKKGKGMVVFFTGRTMAGRVRELRQIGGWACFESGQVWSVGGLPEGVRAPIAYAARWRGAILGSFLRLAWASSYDDCMSCQKLGPRVPISETLDCATLQLAARISSRKMRRSVSSSFGALASTYWRRAWLMSVW